MAVGDLYQLTAAGAVVASLSSALIMGEGLAVAVGALTVSDFALLGSASIVTGAVAAIGAALTRPEMVESLCLLIATLQTLWCLFPQTRRQGASVTGEEVRCHAPMSVIASLNSSLSMRSSSCAVRCNRPCLVFGLHCKLMHAAKRQCLSD